MLSYTKKLAVLAVAFFSLLGCLPQITPPVSGTVADDELHKSWDLTKDQLDELYSWLQSHQSDWGMVLATPPGPSYSVKVQHTDGMRTEIDLYSINESWKHGIRIIFYGSDGKFIDSQQATLPFEDIARLKDILRDQGQKTSP